ncbi:MAG: tryptophan-rich sensory protein [Coleofasciculaceae cyanobacterium]
MIKRLSQYFHTDVARQLLNLVAILAAFGTNVLANVAPIGGLTIGEISNQIFKDVLITPANYAFAIWGVIYLGLISLAVYQALPKQKQNPTLRRMGYLLALSSLAQIGWVFAFQYRLFALSLLAMLGVLLPLIGIYLRLGIAIRRVGWQDRWFVFRPISIYLGWISVATIVNVALVLYNWDWSGGAIGGQKWTVIMVIVAAILATIVNTQRSDAAYTLVIVWALVAIAVRHANTLVISATAGGLAIALFLLVIFKPGVR